jgi:hypothetical protein
MIALGGGGSRRGNNVLELLADSNALKSAIEAHNQATEARNKSAEEYKKAKADALEAIDKLNQKQGAYDLREQELNARKKSLDDYNNELDKQFIDHKAKVSEFEAAKSKLEKDKEDHLQSIQQTKLYLNQKDMQIAKRDNDLGVRESEALKYDALLKKRELLVFEREQFILMVGDKLMKKT